jgi:excisionase family DNA binding protein
MAITHADSEYETHLRAVEQAARELNLSEATIRAWIIQRRIGFVKLGKSVRVPATEIRRLLDGGFRAASR